MTANATPFHLAANSHRWRGLMLAVALLGAGWIWVTRSPAPPASDATASPRAGFTAPDFSLQTLDGQAVTLADLRRQAVMINL